MNDDVIRWGMLVFGFGALGLTIWFGRWLAEESDKDYPNVRKFPKMIWDWLNNQ